MTVPDITPDEAFIAPAGTPPPRGWRDLGYVDGPVPTSDEVYTTRWGITPPRHVRAAEAADYFAAAAMERRALERQVGRAMAGPLPVDTTPARRTLDAMTNRETDMFLKGGRRG